MHESEAHPLMNCSSGGCPDYPNCSGCPMNSHSNNRLEN